MKLSIRVILVGGALGATLAYSHSAEASCGLEYCTLPRNAVSTRPKSSTIRIQTRIRHVEFSLPEGQGSYQESVINVAIKPTAKWRFGGWIAPVRLSTGGETKLGVTNPVAFVEREFSIRNNLKMVVAMQLEVPLGSSAEGIASAHTEILPYLGVSYRMERLTLQLNLGLAMALGESDSHGHDHAAGSDHETPLLVNPHEDKEALSRAAVLVSFLGDRGQSGVFLNSRIPLDTGEKGVVTGALTSTYNLSSNVSLSTEIELPVSSERRFDWRAGVGVGWRY